MFILGITTDIINLLFALVATMILTMIVFRTTKRLDTVFKFYLATAVTLLIASAIRMNEYMQLFSAEFSDYIFIFSRVLSLIFFIFGSIIMLFIIEKESR